MGIFVDEIMTCTICGFKQLAHYDVESGWWCVSDGNRKIYICPKCFGSTYGFCNTCKIFVSATYRKCPLCGDKLEMQLKVDKRKMYDIMRKLVKV